MDSAKQIFNQISESAFLRRTSRRIVSVNDLPQCSPLRYHSIKRMQLKRLNITDTDDKNRNKRWQSFNQFIIHESNYLETLNKLQNEIYRSILLEGNVVSKEVADILFHSVEDIFRLHYFFRGLLEICVEDWTPDKPVGGFIWGLVAQPMFLHVYSIFTYNYQHAMKIFTDQMASNEYFKWFITSKLRLFSNNLNFEGYLIQPVQRLPQLIMEIKELTKYTPATHPDHIVLEKCLYRVEAIMLQINNRIRPGRQKKLIKSMKKFSLSKRYTFSCNYRETEVYLNEIVQEVESSNNLLKNVSKKRQLILMSDQLICAKQEEKNQLRQSDECHPILLVKWMIPLEHVELETNKSENMDCKKIIKMVADYEAFKQMYPIACTLNNEYNSFTEATINRIMLDIRSTVLQDLSNERSLSFTILRKGRRVRYTFEVQDAKTKVRWLHMINLAKLKMHFSNSPGWWQSMKGLNQPCFVRPMSTENDVIKWTAYRGCCCTPNLKSSTFVQQELLKIWSTDKEIVWVVALDDSANSKVTLYTNCSSMKLFEDRDSFLLEKKQISCIGHVPDGFVCFTLDTVWMTCHNELLIYPATYPIIKQQLLNVTIDGSPKVLMYYMGKVYIGMANGNLLIYQQNKYFQWEIDIPLVLKLNSDPVSSMTRNHTNVYVAAGSKLYIIHSKTSTLLRTVEPQATFARKNSLIKLLEFSENGIWIVWCETKIVSLYHPTCFKHILDIDITKQIRHSLSDEQKIIYSRIYASKEMTGDTISAMMIAQHTLWIGTEKGIIMTLQLPQYANVPIMTSNINVSYHAHFNKVNFLMSTLPKTAYVDFKVADEADIQIFPGRIPAKDMVVEEQNLPHQETSEEVANQDCTADVVAKLEGPFSMLVVSGGLGYVNTATRGTDISCLSHDTRTASLYTNMESSNVTSFLNMLRQNSNLLLWEQQL